MFVFNNFGDIKFSSGCDMTISKRATVQAEKWKCYSKSKHPVTKWDVQNQMTLPYHPTIKWFYDKQTIFKIILQQWNHFVLYTCTLYGSRSTRREPPTLGKQLVNFITCGCESCAPFFVIYKAEHEPTSHWWYACMSC